MPGRRLATASFLAGDVAQRTPARQEKVGTSAHRHELRQPLDTLSQASHVASSRRFFILISSKARLILITSFVSSTAGHLLKDIEREFGDIGGLAAAAPSR